MYKSFLGEQLVPGVAALLEISRCLREPARANFIGMVSDFRSGGDFPLQTIATFRFIPGVSWSDHRSFWRQGYQALMVTDTAPYRIRTITPPPTRQTSLRIPSSLGAAFKEIAQKGLD